VLECDTKIMSSPLTKGFLWLNQIYFPFPAYIQFLQDLRRRPLNEQSGQLWEAMSDNYEAWFGPQPRDDGPLFHLLAKLALHAWEACEAASKQSGVDPTPPRIVSSMRHTLAGTAQPARNTDSGQSNIMVDEFPMPVGLGNLNLPDSMGLQDGYMGMSPGMYPGIPGQAQLEPHLNHLDWGAFGVWPGWEDS